MKRKLLALLLTVLMIVPAMALSASATQRTDATAFGTVTNLGGASGVVGNGLYTIRTNDQYGTFYSTDVDDGSVTVIDPMLYAGGIPAGDESYSIISTNYKVGVENFSTSFKNYANAPYSLNGGAFTTIDAATPTLSWAWTTTPVTAAGSDWSSGCQNTGLIAGAYKIGDYNPYIDSGIVITASTWNYGYNDAHTAARYTIPGGTTIGGAYCLYAHTVYVAIYENHELVAIQTMDEGEKNAGGTYKTAILYSQDEKDFGTEDQKNKNISLNIDRATNTINVKFTNNYESNKYAEIALTDSNVARLSPCKDYYFSMAGFNSGYYYWNGTECNWGGVNFAVTKVNGDNAMDAASEGYGTTFADWAHDGLEKEFCDPIATNPDAFLGTANPASSTNPSYGKEGKPAIRGIWQAYTPVALASSSYTYDEFIGVTHTLKVDKAGVLVRKGTKAGKVDIDGNPTTANTLAATVFDAGSQVGKIKSLDGTLVKYSLYLTNISNTAQQYRARQWFVVVDDAGAKSVWHCNGLNKSYDDLKPAS